jgi:hypothetical protein
VPEGERESAQDDPHYVTLYGGHQPVRRLRIGLGVVTVSGAVVGLLAVLLGEERNRLAALVTTIAFCVVAGLLTAYPGALGLRERDRSRLNAKGQRAPERP